MPDDDARVPSDESLRHLIETSWADIHHSRVQEWTALGVVVAAHWGLFQGLPTLLEGSTASPLQMVWVAAVLGGVLSTLGLLMTLRHRRLMSVKLSWIYHAERDLGLVISDRSPNGVIPRIARLEQQPSWEGLERPRLFSTSFLLVAFYSTLIAMDVGVIVWIVL